MRSAGRSARTGHHRRRADRSVRGRFPGASRPADHARQRPGVSLDLAARRGLRLEHLQLVRPRARGLHLHGGPARAHGAAARRCAAGRHRWAGVRVLPEEQGSGIAERRRQRLVRGARGAHPTLAAGRLLAQPRAARRRGRAGAECVDQRPRGRGRGRERRHVTDDLGGAREDRLCLGRTVPRPGPVGSAGSRDDDVRGGGPVRPDAADLGGRGGRARAGALHGEPHPGRGQLEARADGQLR